MFLSRENSNTDLPIHENVLRFQLRSWKYFKRKGRTPSLAIELGPSRTPAVKSWLPGCPDAFGSRVFLEVCAWMWGPQGGPSRNMTCPCEDGSLETAMQTRGTLCGCEGGHRHWAGLWGQDVQMSLTVSPGVPARNTCICRGPFPSLLWRGGHRSKQNVRASASSVLLRAPSRPQLVLQKRAWFCFCHRLRQV